MGDWPFDDPENIVTLTVHQVTGGRHPILGVVHDADDGMWQFLIGGPVEMTGALQVPLNPADLWPRKRS
ncbi:MAG: hypothetical protein ACLQGP_06190 [Isosphaeraceae bacterium]